MEKREVAAPVAQLVNRYFIDWAIPAHHITRDNEVLVWHARVTKFQLYFAELREITKMT